MPEFSLERFEIASVVRHVHTALGAATMLEHLEPAQQFIAELRPVFRRFLSATKPDPDE